MDNIHYQVAQNHSRPGGSESDERGGPRRMSELKGCAVPSIEGWPLPARADGAQFTPAKAARFPALSNPRRAILPPRYATSH